MKVDPIASLRMPFGKHKGTTVFELPSDYLCWLTTADLDEPLRSAVQYVHRLRFSPPKEKQKRFDISAWYKRLSLEFHPDRRGGSCEGMKAIQRAKELLTEMTQ